MARYIQNFDMLATDALRQDALSIAEAGYAAIDVGEAIKRTLSIEHGELHIHNVTYRLEGRRVFFVGIGKCAQAAAAAIETLLGDSLEGGIALDVFSAEKRRFTKIETYLGTHPLPSEVNVRATRRIIEFLSGRKADDLVIMLISGGGSALLCLPEAPMTYEDEGALFSELTAKGASIQDINTVRRHISRARGGALAAAAYPAEVASLIVSDVPGNDIAHIASGPTVLDASTVADARAILARYDIAFSANIECVETPKEQKYFERVTNVLFLTNQNALKAMQSEAAERGYAVTIVNDRFTGEAHDIGRDVAEKLHEMSEKTALLYAGESTVTLGTHPGIGGRNQEMALGALKNIRAGELVLPFASDGHDNTDYAGAIGDSVTRAHERALNLSIKEYL
ncbi:DUF4147 domain-containing protein, partial [Candidatus Kaiserbacteria bacterium]|nr:DUF4147 domain-containing protein [Candidatus Kaiserbacteria bacterium]